MSLKKSKPLKNRSILRSPKIKVGLSGASGRMGQAVKELIQIKNSGFVLTSEMPLFSVEHKRGSKALKAGFDKWDFRQITGVIDFSSPELFSKALKWCLSNKKPFVSGTTALNATQKKHLNQASKKIPVFYEENMSWGIWQIKKWIQKLSNQASDILLEDIHHKNKKDKPSGTALKLKKHLPAFAQKKLKIKSFRKGEEFGYHRFVFSGEEEQVILEHKALSRRLFAGGALKALNWLVKKPSGFYSFEDLYKEKP